MSYLSLSLRIQHKRRVSLMSSADVILALGDVAFYTYLVTVFVGHLSLIYIALKVRKF